MSGVTIIVGASSGIGRDLALELARSEMVLHLIGRNPERIEAVVEQCRKAGGEACGHLLDVTDFPAVAKWYENLVKDGTEVSTIYHCAARSTFGEVCDLSTKDIEWVYHTNLLSVAQWISLVYPGMAARRSGTIVLLSSLSAFTGFPMVTPYAATKQGLLALARSIWVEAEKDGIGLHAACPEFVRTRIFTSGRFRGCNYDSVMKCIKGLGFPFIRSKRAAKLILSGVRRKKKLIVFPLYAKFMGLLGFRLPSIGNIIHRRIVRILQQDMSPKPPKQIPKELAKQTCVVTGAGSGIGRALTCQLLDAGARVFALDVDKTALHLLAKELAPEALCTILVVDVTSADQMRAVAEEINRDGHDVDLLINNAGVTLIETTANISFAQWRRILDVNFLGMIHGIQAFYPQMIERGSGHIVNVGSIAGSSGYTTSQAYAASKGAVLGYTRSLQAEAASHGVLVSLACLATSTPRSSAARPSRTATRKTSEAPSSPDLCRRRRRQTIFSMVFKNKKGSLYFLSAAAFFTSFPDGFQPSSTLSSGRS